MRLLTIAALVASLLFLSSSVEAQRIVTGGIRHESNTFIPLNTTEENFTVLRGEDALRGNDWAEHMRAEGIEIIPTVHAYASPFGVVARETYEGFRDEILEGARRARRDGPVDAVYLDMHGALHAEGYPDAQVDLVRRVREIVGEDAVIGASFDSHGNLSPEFTRELDLLTAYRTAPHVDGAETRLRLARLLTEAVRTGRRPVVAHLNVPILIPGEKGITAVEPLRSLYARIPSIVEEDGLIDASILVGMPWTDVKRAGMSVQVIAEDSSHLPRAEAEVRRLASAIWERRDELEFDVPTDDIDSAIETALAAPESTVFITDSGDNTTAGAAGDGTLVLERLLAHGVEDAVLAGIVDPEAVAAAERAGVGGTIDMMVGGKLDTVFSEPLRVRGTVRFLTPPTAENQRPGAERPAVVEVDGVKLVLLNRRRSFTSPRDFAEVGIDPLDHEIVVVKLGYLFQGLRDIAPATIMALTPGFAYQVVENLPYENVRRPIYPLDPEMNWEP